MCGCSYTYGFTLRVGRLPDRKMGVMERTEGVMERTDCACRPRSDEHSSGTEEEKVVFHLPSCPAQLLDSGCRREASQPLVSMHSHVFLLTGHRSGLGWALSCRLVQVCPRRLSSPLDQWNSWNMFFSQRGQSLPGLAQFQPLFALCLLTSHWAAHVPRPRPGLRGGEVHFASNRTIC